MEAAERSLLRTTALDAIARAPDRADATLTELGWLDMLAAEPREAIEAVFSAIGTTNATATALDDVLASALGVAPGRDLAVLLPPFATWDPPDRVGLVSARAATATGLLVGDVVVPMTAVELHPAPGVDPDAGLHRANVRNEQTRDAAAWGGAVALGQRAISYQMLGASRAMLELSLTHARERVQFGRPIARFQAVRHRLADAFVAIEALAAALDASADEPNGMTAALAKAQAGRTARAVASHCQQVLAGIGFTTEHPFHRFLKRTMVLDGIFGSADALTIDIGRRILAARAVPTLIDL